MLQTLQLGTNTQPTARLTYSYDLMPSNLRKLLTVSWQGRYAVNIALNTELSDAYHPALFLNTPACAK